ncbi:hypothetical protein [Polymorphospora rubra]|uniref:Glycosyl transferase n=1 Tax=Polymorphospora rubra TaxID=338584 RepID=A0A810N6C2_9ACTN|nr:hypothetical protein [Polymorphospora rubra]BCJ67193.1 glycosyl transferase [Polymorphospora rubra]
MTVADSSPEFLLDRPKPAAPDDVTDGVAPGRGRPTAGRVWRWSKRRADLLIVAVYVVTAVWVTGRLWVDPAGRVAPALQSDPSLMQWFLAHAVRVVTHGENPLFTERMNVPDGVNLMANTPMLGLSLPMVPVTMLFGPAVAFVTLVTLMLSGTAAAWYFVLSRHLVSSRAAAAVGGWFCGFCPAMLAHANWHPNIIGQVLVPFIVWRVLVLCRPGARPVRDGLILAALVVYQAFINEEILLFTALACAVFLLAYVLQRREMWAPAWRRLLGGLAVCAVVAGALLAYPLYVQFAGPQNYQGIQVAHFGNDLAAFTSFGTPTLGGNELANQNLAPNPSEENSFFGWPLVLLLVVLTVWLWRDAVVRALAFSALFFALLSLGSVVSYQGREIGPGPWALFVHLPLLHFVVPTRFGMIASTLVGVILAVATDRVLSRRAAGVPGVSRRAWALALAMALVPLIPVALPARGRPAVPDFVTSGTWRSYVAEGQTVVPVPVTENGNADGLRWAAATRLDMSVPRGYFLGPSNGQDGDVAAFGAPPSQGAGLLARVAVSGVPADVDDRQRRLFIDDLRYWNAAIVVLPVRHLQAPALRRTVEDLLGPGQRVDDVWVWDVREIATPRRTETIR